MVTSLGKDSEDVRSTQLAAKFDHSQRIDLVVWKHREKRTDVAEIQLCLKFRGKDITPEGLQSLFSSLHHIPNIGIHQQYGHLSFHQGLGQTSGPRMSPHHEKSSLALSHKVEPPG